MIFPWLQLRSGLPVYRWSVDRGVSGPNTSGWEVKTWPHFSVTKLIHNHVWGGCIVHHDLLEAEWKSLLSNEFAWCTSELKRSLNYTNNIIRRRWKDRKGPWSATRLRVHKKKEEGKFQGRLTVSEVVMVLKSPDWYFWCFWSSETEPFWGPCAIHWFMEAKSAMRWRTVKRWRCPSHSMAVAMISKQRNEGVEGYGKIDLTSSGVFS